MQILLAKEKKLQGVVVFFSGGPPRGTKKICARFFHPPGCVAHLERMQQISPQAFTGRDPRPGA